MLMLAVVINCDESVFCMWVFILLFLCLGLTYVMLKLSCMLASVVSVVILIVCLVQLMSIWR